MAKYNRLDILINNAGILRDRSFARLTDDDWDRIIAIHLTASYKLRLRLMKLTPPSSYDINVTGHFSDNCLFGFSFFLFLAKISK